MISLTLNQCVSLNKGQLSTGQRGRNPINLFVWQSVNICMFVVLKLYTCYRVQDTECVGH